MSITSALNAAMTGLTAAARSSQVVSENLANALTRGYAPRALLLSSGGDGVPGVRIGDVQRILDPGIQSGRRSAEADLGATSVAAGFYSRMAELVGGAEDEYSIATRLTDFEASLVEAASRPESGPRLNDLAIQAEELANSISEAAEGLRSLRTAADRAIGSQVETVNTALKQVQKLNARIMVTEAGGMDISGMVDERDKLIDQINGIIPVKVAQRDNNQVALFSEGGVTLLDGSAAELSFDMKTDTKPHMTQANGLLSGLEVNGRAIDTSAGGPLRGGSLAAQFELRDVTSVDAQADLDAMARDLIERFQDPALDSTLAVGDPGLFTDEGAAFDAANETGIANRIALNDLVSMTGQGETWRLRDGLNAAAPGDPGDATLLRAYSDALGTLRTVTSAGLGTTDVSAATLGANLMSRFAQSSHSAEQALSFASAIYTEMEQKDLAQGVDSDTELQNLLLIEKAYAANAKVITVVDELMETLLRI